MVDIRSIDDLLSMPLAIPDYQRAYKWTVKNIKDLMGDISDAVGEYWKDTECAVHEAEMMAMLKKSCRIDS